MGAERDNLQVKQVTAGESEETGGRVPESLKGLVGRVRENQTCLK